MTKLDLNAFGVQELSSKEKMEVDGGDAAGKALAVIGAAAAVLSLAAVVCTGPVGIAMGVMAGAMTPGLTITAVIKEFAE